MITAILSLIAYFIISSVLVSKIKQKKISKKVARKISSNLTFASAIIMTFTTISVSGVSASGNFLGIEFSFPMQASFLPPIFGLVPFFIAHDIDQHLL